MSKLLLLLSALLIVTPCRGQEAAGAPTQQAASIGPAQGMVWDMPTGADRAMLELREMQRIGVEAVRTDIIRNAEVLTLADTLGISLYIDLPLAHYPADRLRDSLTYAAAVLDTVLGLAQIHPSIRNIGLTRHSDVTEGAGCQVLEHLAQAVRRNGPTDMRTYYVTRFISDDQCAGSVDFVLLDVRDHKDPVAALRAASNGAVVGIGAIGTWVRSDTLSGLSVRSSPEAQARFFEQHLPILLSDTLSVRPPVVFVYRWRDLQLPYPVIGHDLDQPYISRYGLRTIQGVERPAFDVVEGIYTGRQSTFAFPRGRQSPGRAPWTTWLGWGVIAFVMAYYALAPRFRHMLPRYFAARFFYRDAVREGRDVMFGASTVLLIAISTACGLTFAVITDILRSTDAAVTAVQWLPPNTQDVLVTLLAEPYVLVVLAGCVYAVAMILWTTLLAVLSHRRYRIAPGQALMLVVWPRWPLLLVMLGAMVVASMGDAEPVAALILAGAWMLVSLLSVGRALMDFLLVTHVPGYLLIVAALLNPGVVMIAIVALGMLPIQSELRFLWHIATRA